MTVSYIFAIIRLPPPPPPPQIVQYSYPPALPLNESGAPGLPPQQGEEVVYDTEDISDLIRFIYI